MTTPLPDGWLELGGCTETRSIDGSKWLHLSDDNSAELRESSRNKEQLSKGVWSFDPAEKRYVVTIDGAAMHYLLLDAHDIPGCMLVKGTFGRANLRQSWFSRPTAPAMM